MLDEGVSASYLLLFLSQERYSVSEELMILFSSLPGNFSGNKLAMESLIIVVLIHIQIHHLLLLESFLSTSVVAMVVALVG